MEARNQASTEMILIMKKLHSLQVDSRANATIVEKEDTKPSIVDLEVVGIHPGAVLAIEDKTTTFQEKEIRILATKIKPKVTTAARVEEEESSADFVEDLAILSAIASENKTSFKEEADFKEEQAISQATMILQELQMTQM